MTGGPPGLISKVTQKLEISCFMAEIDVHAYSKVCLKATSHKNTLKKLLRSAFESENEHSNDLSNFVENLSRKCKNLKNLK